MADAELTQAGVFITRTGPARTVAVGAACPASMHRPGVWRMDDYELHKQLYKGKASILYSATCKKSGIPVALKLYRKPRLSELNWFQVNREIQLHSSLKHEFIIDFFAAFEDADNVYIVQEYAVGGDLYGELKRCGGRFKDKNVARDILMPCMLALQYCHQKGVIHRDIKPENILLTQHKHIRLADFGLSIDATLERPVTRAGTLDYMAPEVLTCPEKNRPEENKDKAIFVYTQLVDAWAMGILAFECLSGRPPFERSTRTETYEHIMYRKHSCPTYFSKDSVDFIARALSKVASKRASISELLAHPWIAQYSNPKDSRIPAYHPTPVPAAQAKAGEEGGAPSSVLDAGKALSSTGEASGHSGDSLAETVRPGGGNRPVPVMPTYSHPELMPPVQIPHMQPPPPSRSLSKGPSRPPALTIQPVASGELPSPGFPSPAGNYPSPNVVVPPKSKFGTGIGSDGSQDLTGVVDKHASAIPHPPTHHGVSHAAREDQAH
ncbi:hypothetical protein WJX73_001902 [Symbiochloris irregularis]|uniref:Protein kinase domain-containing protein n=1 Tax=Symbiochloris irregularis TaxID=706552 RepID=A0AAW1NQ19_9CHLO